MSHSHSHSTTNDNDSSMSTMSTSTPTTVTKSVTGGGGGGGGHGGHGSGPAWAPGTCALMSDPGITTLPYSYENSWIFIWVMIFFFFLLPYANYLRMVGNRDDDTNKLRRAKILYIIHWLSAIILTIGTNPINHAPSFMQPFDTRIIFGLWVVILPLYLMGRDCGLGKYCCYRSSEFCQFQGTFWDFGVMGVGSFGVTLNGLWTTIGYHELNTDIGHLIPALGFLSYSGLLLYFSGSNRRQSINLVRAEGWMWISWGLFFDTYFTIIMVGIHGWFSGEEHLYQAFMYIWCGATAILFSRMGIRTSFPLATLCLTMGFMMMNHGQQCTLVSMMHRTTGMMFLIAGVLRYTERLLEASFFMALAAGTFAFTGNSQALWADAYFDAMSYVYVSMIFTGAWWAYCAWLFQSYWHHHHQQQEDSSNINGSSSPSRVVAVDGNGNKQSSSQATYHAVKNHDDGESTLKTEDVGDGV
jgi:hypothetical protein